MKQRVGMSFLGLWLLTFLVNVLLALALPNSSLPLAIIHLSVVIPLAFCLVASILALIGLALFIIVSPWLPEKKW